MRGSEFWKVALVGYGVAVVALVVALTVGISQSGDQWFLGALLAATVTTTVLLVDVWRRRRH